MGLDSILEARGEATVLQSSDEETRSKQEMDATGVALETGRTRQASDNMEEVGWPNPYGSAAKRPRMQRRRRVDENTLPLAAQRARRGLGLAPPRRAAAVAAPGAFVCRSCDRSFATAVGLGVHPKWAHGVSHMAVGRELNTLARITLTS
mgnify:CR=1 FL=1